MSMRKLADLPREPICSLDFWDQTDLLRRQLPRAIRRRFYFAVAIHPTEQWPWVVVRFVPSSGLPHFPDLSGPNPVVSGAMIDKPKRYYNVLYSTAVLDEELVAYLCVAA